jgi:hypothetical protein
MERRCLGKADGEKTSPGFHKPQVPERLYSNIDYADNSRLVVY